MIGTCCILGRTPRTKETLSDFHEWCRVTRHPRIFRGLTGCQWTPEKWGVTGMNGASFRRSYLLPNHFIGNNESVSEYLKFHIQGEFSRNCSSFSKSCFIGAYRLVERPKRKRCSGGMIHVGTEFKGLVYCSRQHNNIPLEMKTKKNNLFEREMRDILFHRKELFDSCSSNNFHDTSEQQFMRFNDS